MDVAMGCKTLISAKFQELPRFSVRYLNGHGAHSVPLKKKKKEEEEMIGVSMRDSLAPTSVSKSLYFISSENSVLM